MKQVYFYIFFLLSIIDIKAQAYFENRIGESEIKIDTIESVNLDSVSVSANRIDIKENAPSGDKLNIKHLRTINTQNVGDAAKFLGGVLVKDYGGLGGIKTVSVRGLSSNHTAVMYDGVNLFDNQSGQIDLSKYSLSSINSLSLANAQFNSNLPTATSLASASSVNLETKKPNMSSKKLVGDMGITYGSFNLFNGNMFLASKVTNKDIVTLMVDVINTNGRYPYRLYYGNNQTLSSERLKRENNDMFASHGEINWFHTFSSRQSLKAKAFYYYSDRGLPSSVSLYYQNSKQRLWNKNFFAQTDYTFLTNDRLTYKNYLKVDWNYTRYIDPNFLGGENGQDDNYTQKLAYINNAISYKFKENLFATVTNDLSYNSLDYTILETTPKRFSSLSAVILNYKYKKVIITANVIHSLYNDWFNSFKKSVNHLSPFISIRYEKKIWTTTLFYKNIFRMPTFNELYYRRLGNTDLKPEKTNQISWANVWAFKFDNFIFEPEIDLYYNNVRDKIVAIPQNQFLWSMLNYGKVNVYGADFKINLNYIVNQCLKADIKLNYSHQKAIDIDKLSYTYKQNLPYMPENILSLIFGVDYKTWHFGYTCLAVDKRWSLQENASENILKAYTDHTMILSYTHGIKSCGIEKLIFTASINNIFNHQYEVIRSYPMMGRNFNFKIQLDL